MRLVLVTVAMALCCGAETKFYVDQRTDYEKAKEYGGAGPYELVLAKVVTSSGEGRAEILKPRDPQKGNSTMVLEVNGKGRLSAPESALQAGSTIVRLTWPDTASRQSGIADVVSFLRYDGGPMLMGDQRRFIKRVVAVDNGPWLGEFVASAKNKDAKGRVLIEGALRGEQARRFDVAGAQAFTN
ncbi:MAG: hypothetical protein H7039_22770 [Bryobacteraceae bacterium]|nr:hypothetical protein [Bryobacteraceae bacterium]